MMIFINLVKSQNVLKWRKGSNFWTCSLTKSEILELRFLEDYSVDFNIFWCKSMQNIFSDPLSMVRKFWYRSATDL